MPILEIRACLVPPGKGLSTPPTIEVLTLTPGDRVFTLIERVYTSALNECRYEIIANPDANGHQNNQARDLFLDYAKLPDDAKAELIGSRLSSFTTRRSNDGLLFLALGDEAGKRRLVLSRFPAEEAVLVEKTRGGKMKLKFTNDVFMKSTIAYKAVVFEDIISPKAFMFARAIDKQIDSSIREISEYWIDEFLDYAMAITGPQGTMHLAKAMKEAIRIADEDTKASLISAVTLSRSLNGQMVDAKSALQRLSLDDKSSKLVIDQFAHDALANQSFRFDFTEFSNTLAYRAVFLDNGVMVSADAVNFNQEVSISQDGEQTQLTTKGKIVKTTIRRTQ